MFNSYKYCLFCFDLLEEIPSGEGEHVFPENIYGFWRIYDVCESCKKYFGKKVDHLPLQNPQILKAIEQLKLNKADKYYEEIKYKGTDVTDGSKVGLILKKGKFRTKAKEIDENFYECSEDNWERIGVEWLSCKSNLPKDEFDSEIKKLREQYNKLKTGGTASSSKLGFSIRKRSVKDINIDEENITTITPLIAKIVVSFMSYFFHLGNQIL